MITHHRKLGLALSGGGFRASFFHLGVLARLADADLLRHVDVISTVSGGSIVGALYYVKLKHLLETKSDEQITGADYQHVVHEVAELFRAGVRQNLRLRTFVNPIKNMRMRRADYSRSDRVAELYDRYFYRPAMGPERTEPVLLRELLIHPRGAPKPFHPDTHNSNRRAKVPILLINATSLNTGRNWRFEAIRMGEPPAQDSIEIDSRMQLMRPPSFDEMTPHHRDITLGHAVAASAAVPAIFFPLAISRLYPGVRVELIDGGVHDNQGVAGLIDRGCSQFIISDGSGHLSSEKQPSTFSGSVLARSNGIMMSRVREGQLMHLIDSRGPKNLCLLHLQKGLAAEVVPFINQHRLPAPNPSPKPNTTQARFRTAPEVQRALSAVRTDLDAFHDAEAYSLMENGYQMARAELPKADNISSLKKNLPAFNWPFHAVQPFLQRPPAQYLKTLRVASHNSFKLLRLSRKIATACVASLIACVLLIAWWGRSFWAAPAVSPSIVPTAGAVFVVAALVILHVIPIGRQLISTTLHATGVATIIIRAASWVARFIFRGLLPALGSIPIYLYLVFLNPLYLQAGDIRNFTGGPHKLKKRPHHAGDIAQRRAKGQSSSL